MNVRGIYCKDCGVLIGAEDTDSGEREYTSCWCGYDDRELCFSCDDPFNIPVEEWFDDDAD